MTETEELTYEELFQHAVLSSFPAYIGPNDGPIVEQIRNDPEVKNALEASRPHRHSSHEENFDIQSEEEGKARLRAIRLFDQLKPQPKFERRRGRPRKLAEPEYYI